MTRIVTTIQRRALSRRAAAKGMTVEEYLDWADRDHERQRDATRSVWDREYQRATIRRHALQHGRVFLVLP